MTRMTCINIVNLVNEWSSDIYEGTTNFTCNEGILMKITIILMTVRLNIDMKNITLTKEKKSLNVS